MHPRRPLAASPTPACIHPQVLPLPSSLFLSRSLFLLLYTIAVCSMIILRFFLLFSSKLCAPRLILYHICFSSFSPLFLVNDSFHFSAFKGSRGTIPFDNMQYTLFYFISFALFFCLPFFILIVGCSSLSYFLHFPRLSDRCPIDSFSFFHGSVQSSLLLRPIPYDIYKN